MSSKLEQEEDEIFILRMDCGCVWENGYLIKTCAVHKKKKELRQ